MNELINACLHELIYCMKLMLSFFYGYPLYLYAYVFCPEIFILVPYAWYTLYDLGGPIDEG